MSSCQYILLYKPYGVISQFSRVGEKITLKNLLPHIPTDIYPVGRLDEDSEGALLLTNDKRINGLLLQSEHPHPRTYYVQVEGTITDTALQKIAAGIPIRVDGKIYHTKPCEASKMDNPPSVPDRIPPIRYRKTVPTSWIKLTLREGKNRQVRKMTAAVGFPTLRLIRYAIGNITIATMQPGDYKMLRKETVYALCTS